MKRFRLLTFLLVALAACSSPAQDDEDDPFTHRTLTAWSPLVSTDGTRVALVLEPRSVDADERGVMVLGWRAKVIGPPALVVAHGPGSGDRLADLPLGVTHVTSTSSTHFIWTEALAEWVPEAPNDPPPITAIAAVTRADRATLTVAGTTQFDPPLASAAPFGSNLVMELPRAGRSDIVREIRVASHNLDSLSIELLHSAMGLSASWCRRDAGLTLAYQRQDDPYSTTVVDVSIDVAGTATVHTLLIDDFKPTQVICQQQGDRAAVVGVRTRSSEWRTVVLSPGASEILMDGPGGSPAALSLDGRSLLSTGSDGGMSIVTAKGPTALQGPTKPDNLIVSGDRALISTPTGTWAASMVGADATKISDEALDLNPRWATGDGGFLGVETAYDSQSHGDRLKRLFYLAPSGDATTLPLTDSGGRPFVFFASPSRGYLMASSERAATLWSVDIAAATIGSQEPFPLCDDGMMKAKRGCLP